MAKPSDGKTSDGAAAAAGSQQNLGYLCVYSRSDPAIPNVPLLRATNPIGSMILGSGLMPVFGHLAEALGPRGDFTGLPALPAPAVNGSAPGAGPGPPHGGTSGRR